MTLWLKVAKGRKDALGSKRGQEASAIPVDFYLVKLFILIGDSCFLKRQLINT